MRVAFLRSCPHDSLRSGTRGDRDRRPVDAGRDPRLREGQPQPRRGRAAQPRRPTTRPSLRGGAGREEAVEDLESLQRQGLRVAPSRTRSRSSSASRRRRSRGAPCRSTSSFRPGKKPFDFYIAQVSYTPERAKNVDVLELVLLRQPGRGRATRHASRDVKTVAGLTRLQARRDSSGRRATTTSSRFIRPSQTAARLRLRERRGHGAQDEADRRHRRRLPDARST